MKERKPLQLRLPEDVKSWVKDQAEQNASSMNAEITRAIRASMAASTTATEKSMRGEDAGPI